MCVSWAANTKPDSRVTSLFAFNVLCFSRPISFVKEMVVDRLTEAWSYKENSGGFFERKTSHSKEHVFWFRAQTKNHCLFEGSSCSTNQTDQEALCNFEVAANLPSQMNLLPHLLGLCRSHLANERSCITSQLWHLGSPFNTTSLQLERMQNVTITSLHTFVNHFVNINKELKKLNTFGRLQKRHRLHLVNKVTRWIQLRNVHSNLKITNTHQTNCQT